MQGKYEYKFKMPFLDCFLGNFARIYQSGVVPETLWKNQGKRDFIFQGHLMTPQNFEVSTGVGGGLFLGSRIRRFWLYQESADRDIKQPS
ncbi:hypothetical protein XELAEV_18029853mg [Xenopus laevis]|uniref:Uncharacterized protein n=1 Tax=Xenopus laevis TaxID=8355 RepID=A0A974CSX1_XENLA|nr:hypothetical protein XELAEV_18029853mg [Xenopus laevis]